MAGTAKSQSDGQLARKILFWILGALLTLVLGMGAAWTGHVERGLKETQQMTHAVDKRLERIETKLQMILDRIGSIEEKLK